MSRPFALNNDMVFLVIEAPGGIYSPENLAAIADLCDSENLSTKITEDQRIGLMVASERREQIVAVFKQHGIVMRDYQSGVHQAVSCLGKFCPLAQQDALSTAVALSDKFAGMDTKVGIKLGVNACSRCCVPTHTLDVSLIGEENGYRVSIGGKTSQIPEFASFVAEAVPASEIVDLVAKAIDVYQAEAQDDESVQDVMQRVGMTPFAKAFAPYSQDAAGDSDPFATNDEAPAAANPQTTDEDLLGFVQDDTTLVALDETPAEIVDEEVPDVELHNLASDATIDDIAPTFGESNELSDDVMIHDEPLPIEEPLEFTEADLTATEPEAPAEDILALSQDSEVDELAMETKLEESIIEQEAIGSLPADENDAERDHAFQQLEVIEEPIHDTAELEQLAESFSDVESIHEETISSVDVLEDQNPSRQNDDHLGLVEGMSFSEEFLTLNFSHGAVINVDLLWLKEHGGRRNFSMNGHTVSVIMNAQGIRINVDGVEIQLPESAVAAA